MDDIHFCACSTMEIYQISGDPDMVERLYISPFTSRRNYF